MSRATITSLILSVAIGLPLCHAFVPSTPSLRTTSSMQQQTIRLRSSSQIDPMHFANLHYASQKPRFPALHAAEESSEEGGGEDVDNNNNEEAEKVEMEVEVVTEESSEKKKKKSIWGKFMAIIKPQSSEKISTKEMLKKMGLSMLLSYGFVSNITSVIITSMAWFTFSKKTGLSPLAPGQWKGFLAIYAGFYVFTSLIRPIRMAMAVGISKYFDLALNTIQEKTKVSKGVAIGILVFLTNIVGTCGVMALGVSLASLLSGVPIFPAKLLL